MESYSSPGVPPSLSAVNRLRRGFQQCLARLFLSPAYLRTSFRRSVRFGCMWQSYSDSSPVLGDSDSSLPWVLKRDCLENPRPQLLNSCSWSRALFIPLPAFGPLSGLVKCERANADLKKAFNRFLPTRSLALPNNRRPVIP